MDFTHRNLLVLTLLYSLTLPTTTALYDGCVVTKCGASSCPKGLTEHIRVHAGTDGSTGPDHTLCGGGGLAKLCCPFPNENGEWNPLKPTDGHHACFVDDPCPAKKRVAVYTDVYGPEQNDNAQLCSDPQGAKYWYCETKPAAAPPAQPPSGGGGN
ncbi:hypothetical protein FQN53_006147, partial [Emmonsiellopsis sp. PD_33]